MIADAERIRHDGERRVHGTARGQEAPVDDVEVVDVVGLAVVPHRVAPVSRGDVEVTETARLLAVPTRSASPTTAVMSVETPLKVPLLCRAVQAGRTFVRF